MSFSSLTAVPSEEIPKLMVGSSRTALARAEFVARFLKMVSYGGVKVLKLTYCDTASAIELIGDLLEGSEKGADCEML